MQRRCNVPEGHEGERHFIIACSEPSVMFEAIKKPVNFISLFVLFFVWLNRPYPIRSIWNHGYYFHLLA